MTLRHALLPACGLAIALAVAGVGWSAPAVAAGGGGVSSSRSSDDGDETAKRYAKAVKKIKKEEYKDAVKLLEKVVRKQPNNADAYNYLGYSHRKLKDVKKAYDYYVKALEIDPKHRGALEYLGELYLETGDLDNAKVLLQRLAAACPSGCEERQELAEKVAAYSGKSGG
jgi:Flp pilus assembly protein TadD